MRRRLLLLFLLVAPLAACASTPTPVSPESSSHITADEIASLNATTAYQIIQRTRAEFLHSRGPVTILTGASSSPIVYVDYVRYGSVSALRGISASDVAEIWFLSSRDATTKYGMGHAAGAIEVITKR
ncbi:MAG TPA: hypothetical protein VJ803_02905 [Gemmatimonadaceae bacterium]|nr:hypothetical protein [Gemmatimonadaceae bacterium]